MDTFEMLEKPDAILVIGNGFDKHCGLNSSFSDFFYSTLMDENKKPIFERINKNIWYIIFYYAFMIDSDKGGRLIKFIDNDNPLWMDIENYIDKTLRSNKDSHPLLPLYDFINAQILTASKFNQDITTNGRTIVLSGDDKNQRYIIKQKIIDLKTKQQYKNAGELLFSELLKFENDFANYLKKEVADKNKAYKKAIQEFVVVQMDNFGSNSIYVYSFNYTTTFQHFVDKTNFRNVHGTIESNNIIIGIKNDETHLLPGGSSFTKVNRIREGNISNSKLPNNEITKVFFYGCSFGELDYSYYEFLFKKYRLGQQNSKFYFLFSEYGRDKNEILENKNRYFDNVKKTIDRFNATNSAEKNYNDLVLDDLIAFLTPEQYRESS